MPDGTTADAGGGAAGRPLHHGELGQPVPLGRAGAPEGGWKPNETEPRLQHTAENLLDWDFHADRTTEKWLTDVTEFRYYTGASMRKLYLSAILDLCDRRIVAFTLRDTNNTTLFQDTLDQAIAATPNAHPPFHNFQVPYVLKEQSSVNLRYTGIIPLTRLIALPKIFSYSLYWLIALLISCEIFSRSSNSCEGITKFSISSSLNRGC